MTTDAGGIRLAIVSSSLSRAAGGILPIMQNHAKELFSMGHKVSVHGVFDEFSEADRSGWGSVPLYLSESCGPKRFGFSPGIVKSIDLVDPQIVHQHGIWQYQSVAVAHWRRRTHRPTVVSVQGMLEAPARSFSPMKKRIAATLFEKRNLRKASAIHASAAELPGVRAFSPDTPVALLPNGAELPPSGSYPYPEFLPKDGRRTLLFLGRLHPKKGISETLQAWRILKSNSPHIVASWRLAVVGWGDADYCHTLQNEIISLGLSDDVIIPGALFGRDKESVLHHADAFILASYSEGFPMAVLEALAYELPVFITSECNIHEAFEAGAAFRVTTDPEKIAEVLKHGLCLSPDRLSEMGRRGAELIVRQYSWRRIALNLCTLYNYLLGRSSDRPDFLV